MRQWWVQTKLQEAGCLGPLSSSNQYRFLVGLQAARAPWARVFRGSPPWWDCVQPIPCFECDIDGLRDAYMRDYSFRKVCSIVVARGACKMLTNALTRWPHVCLLRMGSCSPTNNGATKKAYHRRCLCGKMQAYHRPLEPVSCWLCEPPSTRTPSCGSYFVDVVKPAADGTAAKVTATLELHKDLTLRTRDNVRRKVPVPHGAFLTCDEVWQLTGGTGRCGTSAHGVCIGETISTSIFVAISHH